MSVPPHQEFPHTSGSPSRVPQYTAVPGKSPTFCVPLGSYLGALAHAVPSYVFFEVTLLCSLWELSFLSIAPGSHSSVFAPPFTHGSPLQYRIQELIHKQSVLILWMSSPNSLLYFNQNYLPPSTDTCIKIWLLDRLLTNSLWALPDNLDLLS